MYKYIIRCVTGLQGSSYYRTHAEALNAAKFRTNCTGLPWYVDAVKIRYEENREKIIEEGIDLEEWSNW